VFLCQQIQFFAELWDSSCRRWEKRLRHSVRIDIPNSFDELFNQRLVNTDIGFDKLAPRFVTFQSKCYVQFLHTSVV
jgi:hypothetical protein